MIELLGTLAMLIAISGVCLNNRKIIWCFPLWLVSNTLTLYVHLDAGIVSLVLRDAVFLGLAVHGWRHWAKGESDEQ